MTTHRHLGSRHLIAALLLGGLVAAAPATARHEDRARFDVVRLAHGLEVATDDVRRATRGGFWGRRGGDALLDRELAELQRQAGRFRTEVERRSPSSRHARHQLDALLQRFYDADRTIRRTPVAGHARHDFERARYFMDTLIERYGGYRHFRQVQPSRQGARHHERGHWDRDDRRWDRDDHGRARPRRY